MTYYIKFDGRIYILINNYSDDSAFQLPDSHMGKKERRDWLLTLCKKHVEQFVLRSEVSNLVQQTGQLDTNTQGRYHCRFQGCDKEYVFHSRRVR